MQKRSTAKILTFLFVFFALSLSACSSLLYQPSHEMFVSPERAHLKPDELWIPVKSGKLHAWYFHHQALEKNNKTKALLLFFHGNAENMTSHYLTLKFLLEQGYDFAIFDYRGYGQSVFGGENGEKPSPRSTIEDGIEFLKWGNTYAKAAHIPWVVFAQSLGGAIALRSIIEAKKDFSPDLVIVDSTFSSYEDEGQDVLRRGIITWPFQWLSRLLLSDEWAPGKRIAEISPTPLWVIHGNDDRTVSYSLGREVFHLAKEPKEFWHVEGGHHTDALWAHEGQFKRKLVLKLNQLFAPGTEALFTEYGWSPTRPKEIPVPDQTYTYTLPYVAGMKFKVLQGFDGSFSHQNENRYAIDFSMPEGTQVCAIRDGEVVAVKKDSDKGGPNSAFTYDANFIRVRHEDGTIAEYYHLKPQGVLVKQGDPIKAGEIIGYSGQTGFASEPHLHVAVYFIDSKGVKNTVPIVFDTDQDPAIRLEEGESYSRSKTN